MEHNKVILIDVDENNMENHISDETDNIDFPFEYSTTNVWNKNFFSPENSSNLSFESLYSELEEIKLLIKDIKNILSDIFETKTKDLDK